MLAVTRGIENRPWIYEVINLAIMNEASEEAQTVLMAVYSDNEDNDQVLEDSDESILSIGSEFSFFVCC